MGLFVRRAGVVAVLVLSLSCAESQSGRPGVPTSPTPPPATADAWSVQGTVIETVAGTPVPNASLVFEGFAQVAQAGADGTFRFAHDTRPVSNNFEVIVSAPGYVTRRARLNWQPGDRTGVTIDIIRDAAPFSLLFYRQLVRNASETPNQLEALSRLTTPPSFYIRTVENDRGRPVDPDVVDFVRTWIGTAVTVWTGWPTPTIETGTTVRAPTRDWIRVVFLANNDEFCGRSLVGGNPGSIELSLGTCSCGSRDIAPATIVHEVGHALGFWHVDDRTSVMFPIVSTSCRDTVLTAAERHHSTIAYRRPIGNTDIDTDPISSALLGLFPVMVTD